MPPTGRSRLYGAGATLPFSQQPGDNADLRPITAVAAGRAREAAAIALVRFDISLSLLATQVYKNLVPGHYIDRALVEHLYRTTGSGYLSHS